MLETILCIAAVIVLMLIVFLLKDSVVPKLVKLSGFIGGIIALFLPAYTISIMNEAFEINVIDCIMGINLTSGYGYPANIKSNPIYIVFFIIPLAGIVMTLVKDSKIANAATAILSLLGIFSACTMLFKQLEIGTIIRISANIGIAVMFAAYIISLAISIIKIYGSIKKEEEQNNSDDQLEGRDLQ